MGNIKLITEKVSPSNLNPERESIKKIDIQNLFLYLKQEISSANGLIDKIKA